MSSYLGVVVALVDRQEEAAAGRPPAEQGGIPVHQHLLQALDVGARRGHST